MAQSEGRDSVDITFFVPCLNEERNVTGTLDVLGDTVPPTGISFEILVVDDCSTDDTTGVVKAYAAAHPDLPIVLQANEQHQGLGKIYIQGARMARGRYYMLVNGDNVERREVIAALLAKLGQADITIPYFGKLDNRPLFRRVISRTFTFIVNLLSGNRIGYYNGAVIHLRENVVAWHPGTSGFAYQAELITRLISHGATYVQVEVPSEERQHGVSKAFRPGNFVSVSRSLAKIAARRLFRWA